MKNWKPMKLYLTYENGNEQFVGQDCYYNVLDFEFHKKEKDGWWTKKYRPVRATNFNIDYEQLRGRFIQSYGSGLDIPTGITIQPRRSAQMSITEVNTATRAVSVSASNVLESGRGLVTRDAIRFNSNSDHVRAHNEVIAQMRQQAMQEIASRSEMERRAAQRRDEELRIEQERSRERRPWERVRNFFRD